MNKKIFFRRLSFLFAFLMLFIQSSPLLALSQLDIDAIYGGWPNYVSNVAYKNSCGDSAQVGSSLASGSTIYMIGDSITNMTSDEYRSLFSGAGYSPYINAVGGRAWEWTGNGSEPEYYTPEAGGAQKGKDAVVADAETIGAAGAIVIALGSNGVSDANPISEILTTIRGLNQAAPIYWVNVVSTKTGDPFDRYGDYNKELVAASTNGTSFSIINWFGEVMPGGDPGAAQSNVSETNDYLSSDGLHPNTNGQNALATLVKEQVTSGKTTSGGCCGNTSGANNKDIVFNFFLSKGYTREQAAGVIGNMINESGVQPKKLQGIFDREVGSEEAITYSTQSGKAWGIVQWDPNSKIIQTARDAGYDWSEIDSIDFQLNFLWGQLSGEAWGGNPNNTSNEKRAGDAMLATTTLEEAAIAFGQKYERFKDSQDLTNPEYTKRINSAWEVYNDQTLGRGGGGSGCGAGANGWGLPGESNPMIYYSQLREVGSPKDPAVTSYWGDSPYGEGTIAECGCGPTSFAMIVATYKQDTNVTPATVAAWAHENGFRSGNGTCAGSSWWWTGNPEKTAEKWGVRGKQITVDEAPNYLRQGKLIMVSVGQGSSLLSQGGDGHLLVMRAVTEDGKFLFADPSDGVSKRNNGGDGTNPDIFKGDPPGSSHTPLDAATVSQGLKGLFVIEEI